MVHRVRAEEARDWTAVHAVNVAAFPSAAEADLVEALRRDARPVVSLVACADAAIVGHIMFSPVTLPGHPGLSIMGLGPMAVAPDRQRAGIGSTLVRAGVAACTRLEAGAVVVLGHPEYYPRFGFAPAAGFGIGCEYDAPVEAFMLLELRTGALRGAAGTVRYHPAFATV
jgi:putative acetyltransferase